MHAEISAIKRLDRIYRPGNSIKPRNLHLVSFMIRKKTGTIGISTPCYNCYKALEKFGIKRITYFNDNGEVLQERI